MATEKANMFGSYGAAAEARQQEQSKIEAAVTGAPEEKRPGTVGRPRKRQNATTMTVSISQADKDRVKAYAFHHALTVSDLLHQWIELHCQDD